MFCLIAAAILFATGFEVWGDMEGPWRAVVFALAFWQLQLGLGWTLPVPTPTWGRRRADAT